PLIRLTAVSARLSYFFSRIRHPPGPPLFPYTTLFRSQGAPAPGGLVHGGYSRHRPVEAFAFEDHSGPRHPAQTTAAGFEFSPGPDRKSTRLNSSHLGISYAVFCLKKKTASPCSQTCYV